MLPEGIVDIEVKMTIDERYKYLRKMRERYRVADRQERGQLLSEMEAVTNLHRKSLVRLIHGTFPGSFQIWQRQATLPGRPPSSP